MKRKNLYWILAILWMALIFYLSHQPVTESNRISTGITEKIVSMVDIDTGDTRLNMITFNYLVRKGAHFMAYFILGILTLNGLKGNKIYGFKGIALALFICVLYAMSDEVHQLFVPGRSGQISDVILDSVGAITGIASSIAYSRMRELITNRPSIAR